jgi:hypothetical protein
VKNYANIGDVFTSIGVSLRRTRLIPSTQTVSLPEPPVLNPSGSRCPVSRVPEPRLLDAAIIIIDAHEQMGRPPATNPLPLLDDPHAAFNP